MTLAAQLLVIFAFGLVITGIVFLGVVEARAMAKRAERAAVSSNRDS